MYEDFLDTVLTYIRALNEADKKIITNEGLTPYLGRIPVLLEGCLCGWLADEIGGVWSLQEATPEEAAEYAQKHPVR